MYRILIVDDEPIIVDGMVDLFQQVSDMELEIYKAYSGDEALELLHELMVDVVLSDVRMPGISGLELLDRIREQWPHCKVVFLTAHNDSEYIRTALRSGGADYLLKTESEEAIVDSVRKALAAAEVERRNIHALENARMQLKLAEPILRRELLLGICNGTIKYRGENTELVHESAVPLNFQWPVMLMIGRVDRWKENLSTADKAMLSYAIENITQEMLSLCRLQTISIDDSRMVWFIQPAGIPADREVTVTDWERTIPFLHGTLETVQTVCRELLQIPVSFASGSEPVGWDQVHSAYEALRSLIGRGLGLGKETLLIEGRENRQDKSEVEKQKQQARRLLNRIVEHEAWLENRRVDLYLELLRELEERMQPLSEEAVFYQGMYYSVSTRLLAQIDQWDKQAEVSEQGIDIGKLANIQLHANSTEAFRYLVHVARTLSQTMENEQMESSSFIISMINSYTEEHLDEELSLTTLSKIVHLNANYLSRLYKQITGVCLTDYITDIRIARAKQLLQKSFLRVHEISKHVGFENPAYFSRVFRKQAGMSPQEFREAVKNKDQTSTNRNR
jgi:two-component system response regulator YesN